MDKGAETKVKLALFELTPNSGIDSIVITDTPMYGVGFITFDNDNEAKTK